MKEKLSIFKYVCALCCVAAISWATSASAQTKTVWVIDKGTYEVGTLNEVTDIPVTTTAGAFSSNDYQDAVHDITGGLTNRVFKFGGGVFTMPEGYQATEVTIYGWPRRNGTSAITAINVDGTPIATFDGETPYVFSDCGADVAPGNRTQDNCTIIKIEEISAENPATSFMVDINKETHAFCKIVLTEKGSSGIESLSVDEESADNAYYDLMGRKIEKPAEGLYIHKGKKIILKKQQ